MLYSRTPFPPFKIAHFRGDLDPSNTCFPGPTRVLNPNDISIGSAVFAGVTDVTDRQTDRPRYLVGNNGPHLVYVRRPSTGDTV